MNYDRFHAAYALAKPMVGSLPKMSDSIAAVGIGKLSVGVYNNGLYQVLSATEAAELNQLVESVFPPPSPSEKIDVFASDWMGRLFGTSTTDPDPSGAAAVCCFDLAEPMYFTTDANFDDFHNVIAIDRMAELLNLNQVNEWMALNPLPNDGENCVGYKLPLFLGGKDEVANMEVCNRKVYLGLQVQLYMATRTK